MRVSVSEDFMEREKDNRYVEKVVGKIERNQDIYIYM